MNFPKVLKTLQEEFEKNHIDFALLGGLAIHALGISRTTRDIDCLVLLSDSKKVDELMKRLGYEALQMTEDIANYVSKDWEMGRVDILFAHRKYAVAMLQRAQTIALFGGTVKSLTPEDIIGLKIQSSTNDPDRTHKDLADVETLLKTYAKILNWDLVREYFQIFGREGEFKELQKRFQNAER